MTDLKERIVWEMTFWSSSYSNPINDVHDLVNFFEETFNCMPERLWLTEDAAYYLRRDYVKFRYKYYFSNVDTYSLLDLLACVIGIFVCRFFLHLLTTKSETHTLIQNIIGLEILVDDQIFWEREHRDKIILCGNDSMMVVYI